MDAVALLPQTRRHSALAHLLGLRHTVVSRSTRWTASLSHGGASMRSSPPIGAWRVSLGMGDFEAVPVSALHGDNVVRRSATLDWYRGPTLLELLESVDAHDDEMRRHAPLRFAVQYVDKSDAVAANEAGSRRYLGRVGSGTVNVGQAVQILPAGTAARVAADRNLRRRAPERIRWTVGRITSRPRGRLVARRLAGRSRRTPASAHAADAAPISPGSTTRRCRRNGGSGYGMARASCWREYAASSRCSTSRRARGPTRYRTRSAPTTSRAS